MSLLGCIFWNHVITKCFNTCRGCFCNIFFFVCPAVDSD